MKRPNILILYTDQQRWDALGWNGNPDIRTPHLDRLAARGLSFDHAFVQNPVCMPSRLAFLTGRYPSTHRITHMGVPVPPDTITLPRLLNPYGYRSANIGKLHFLPHANRDHRIPHPSYGFDHLEISDEPGPYEDAYRAWVRRTAPDQASLVSLGLPPLAETWYRALRITDTVEHPPERFTHRATPFRGRSDVTHTAFVAEQSMEFIRQNSDRPWLCVAGFYSPHSPWVAPQEFLDLYDPATFRLPAFPPEIDARRPGTDYSDEKLREMRRGYYAMVSEVDHHCGRLLSLLEDLALANDTIVVFTSDHGDWLGEHLRVSKGYPADDPCSRVPLVIRWGDNVQRPGRRVSTLTEAVDVLPTLLECAGIQVPPHVQGRSLLPVLQGLDETGRTSAITEHAGWRSLRTERFRYVAEANGKETLWDLTADPGGYNDVLNDPAYATALADMRHILVQRLLAAEQPLPRVWGY